MCLGPTHEEVVVDVVADHLSQSLMPLRLYQIGTMPSIVRDTHLVAAYRQRKGRAVKEWM